MGADMTIEIYDVHNTPAGKVRIALDNETYVELTTREARNTAMHLLTQAALAEGKRGPDLVAIRDILNRR
jgi:hypothetical protein